MSWPRARREDGAIAVIVAICTVLMFSVAALAVDLGNAYSRQRDIQTQADLTALAAGAWLPHTAERHADIMAAVQQYADVNFIPGQDAAALSFTDADPDNGWIEFEDEDLIRVTTPPATVDFGFAGAMGIGSTQVAASAAAEIRTPSTALPFFIPNECAWGVVVAIGDPPSGHDDAADGPCSGDNAGNFGTLFFPRNDESGTDDVAARNIIEGIQHGLAVFDAYSGADDDCASQVGAVTALSVPDEDAPAVNCAETDTGNVKQAATKGFITGLDGDPGRLDGAAHPTAPGCDPAGGDAESTLVGVPINDEVLTCYFTSPTVTVGEVGQAVLAPEHEHIVSPEIFESPRFVWLPVLTADPSGGGSGSYAVTGFRGAFLTGQPTTASQVDPHTADTVAASNGLQVHSGTIEGLSVALIHPDALPETAVATSTIPYLGTGTRVVRLIE